MTMEVNEAEVKRIFRLTGISVISSVTSSNNFKSGCNFALAFERAMSQVRRD